MFYHSRRLRFVFGLVLKLMAVFFIFRIIFVLAFIDSMIGGLSELMNALWVGIRFDLRLAVLIVLPVGLMLLIPVVNLLRQPILRKTRVSII